MAITLSTFVKLPKSKKVLFLTIILAVIAGLYAYLFYLPASAEIEKKKVDMGKLETQLRELRTVAENMKRFQADSARLREEVELAMAQLPTSKEIPSLLANITNRGKESGRPARAARAGRHTALQFLDRIRAIRMNRRPEKHLAIAPG